MHEGNVRIDEVYEESYEYHVEDGAYSGIYAKKERGKDYDESHTLGDPSECQRQMPGDSHVEAPPRVHAKIGFEQTDDACGVEEEADDKLKIGERISVGEVEALLYGRAINMSLCSFNDAISPLSSGNTEEAIL
jgi:hypothetical protein